MNPSRTGLGFNNGFNNGFNSNFNNGFSNGNNGFNNRSRRGNNGFNNGFNNNGNVIAYPVPYPVYGGGGYDQPMVEQEPAQTPPNVIVVYPQGQGYPGPGYPGQGRTGPAMAGPQSSMTELPPAPEEPAASTATRYLIALKDHSIYSAVAYFVEGDTLHYFTTGNTHSQIPISQVDRNLTKRLNEDSGLEVKLPPVK